MTNLEKYLMGLSTEELSSIRQPNSNISIQDAPKSTLDFQKYDPSMPKAKEQLEPAYQAITDPFNATIGGDEAAQGRITRKVASNFTDPLAAGTFAGVGAKTADLVNLEKAREMVKGLKWGTPEFFAADKAAWEATGWTHAFPDQKPRFEIPDDRATLDSALTSGQITKWGHDDGIKSIDMIRHPELYGSSRLGEGGAYPDMARISVAGEINPPAGAGTGEYIRSNNIFLNDQINLRPTNVEAVKPMQLHELQHAVQEREGFARGGSPEQMNNEIFDYIKSDYDKILAEKGKNEADLFMSDIMNAVRHDSGQGRFKVNEYKQRAYKNLAGEAEARLTQKRMDLTPEQRRQQYPVEQFDVPVEQQIVRYTPGSVQQLYNKTNDPKVRGLLERQYPGLRGE